MKLTTLLATHNFSNSLLVGYYGGGNYGDELLMETLATMLKKQNAKDVSITYQNPDMYPTFHRDFGYPLVPMHDKRAFLRAIRQHKQIIVGGGGLWGLDVNLNIFLLSFLLLISRHLLGKQIYLLGVGYYNSTSWLGRVSAWLAGKAATHILARDNETFDNFRKITKQVSLDHDIAWNISEFDLSDYITDEQALAKQLHIKHKTLFIALRRFRPHQKNNYLKLIEQCIAENRNKNIIVALMEPRWIDPEGYQRIKRWAKYYPNIQITDFSFNPLVLFLFFRRHVGKLTVIGPQFHLIITAEIAGVPFLPVAYDNKVSRLLESRNLTPIPITKLSAEHLQSFINGYA